MKMLMLVLMSVLFLAGCDEKKTRLKQQNTEQFSEGICLVGCASDLRSEGTKGTLENNTMLAVRIREVVQRYGEKTVRIFVLPSGKTIQLDSLYANSGFYIYTMDGIMIGWISFRCPNT